MAMKIQRKELMKAKERLDAEIALSTTRAREKLMKMGFTMDEIDKIVKVFREG